MKSDRNTSSQLDAMQRQRRIRVALFVSLAISFAIFLSFFYQGIQTFSRLEDVERERDQWQRPDAVIQELQAREGSVIVDFGSGVGYFSMKLSKSVGGSGKVLAVDIEKFPLLVLRTRAIIAGRHNIAAVIGEPDDPHLPSSSANAVLIANTYHELTHPNAVLESLHRVLRPGGRLVVIDHTGPSQAGETREVGAEHHEVPPDLVQDDLRKTGFRIIKREDHFAIQAEEGQVWWLIVASPDVRP